LQDEDEVAPVVANERPAAQLMHAADCSADWYLPVVQLKQSVANTEPVPARYLPAAQMEQLAPSESVR